MENPLSQLALDYWYKVVMVVSVFIFFLAGAGLLPEFPTAATALISIGSFFIGLGEWINHPLQTKLMIHYPRGIITGYPRNNRPIGIAFDILGFAIIGFGIHKLLS